MVQEAQRLLGRLQHRVVGHDDAPLAREPYEVWHLEPIDGHRADGEAERGVPLHRVVREPRDVLHHLFVAGANPDRLVGLLPHRVDRDAEGTPQPRPPHLLEQRLRARVERGRVRRDVDLHAGVDARHLLPDVVVDPDHERLAAEKLHLLEMRHELRELLHEIGVVRPVLRRLLLAVSANRRGKEPVAHDALEVAGILEFELHHPGHRNGPRGRWQREDSASLLRRSLSVLVVDPGLAAGEVAALELPLAHAAAALETVLADVVPELFRRRAEPHLLDAVPGILAEDVGPVVAAGAGLARLLEVHARERRVAEDAPIDVLATGPVVLFDKLFAQAGHAARSPCRLFSHHGNRRIYKSLARGGNAPGTRNTNDSNPVGSASWANRTARRSYAGPHVAASSDSAASSPAILPECKANAIPSPVSGCANPAASPTSTYPGPVTRRSSTSRPRCVRARFRGKPSSGVTSVAPVKYRLATACCRIDAYRPRGSTPRPVWQKYPTLAHRSPSDSKGKIQRYP